MNQRLLTETQRLQTYAGLDDDGYRLDKYGKAIAEKQDAKTLDAVLEAVRFELSAIDMVHHVSDILDAVRARLGEKEN